jgi:hypothetical protein
MSAGIAPACFALPPDYDSIRSVKPQAFRWMTSYRLRIWREARLVMATELDVNAGASITNSIEAVAHDAEVVLRSLEYAEPRTLPFDEGWTLCEHYERLRRLEGPDSFDRVEFEPRPEFYDGELRRPTWSPWREPNAEPESAKPPRRWRSLCAAGAVHAEFAIAERANVRTRCQEVVDFDDERGCGPHRVE